MVSQFKRPASVLWLRWVARIWSIGVLVIALLFIFTPDEYATGEPLAFREIFMLSLWGLAILGLLLAWIWERFGAIFTIVVMFLREIAFYLLYKEWIVNFLLIWAAVIPPAILFLLASSIERKAKKKSAQKPGWDVLEM